MNSLNSDKAREGKKNFNSDNFGGFYFEGLPTSVVVSMKIS